MDEASCTTIGDLWRRRGAALTASGVGSADDRPLAEALARKMSPRALGIAAVRLDSKDLVTASEALRILFPDLDAAAVAQELRRAGARRFFIVVGLPDSLSDGKGSPLLVAAIPASDQQTAGQISAVLRRPGPKGFRTATAETLDGMVVGRILKPNLASTSDEEAPPRQELAKALSAIDDAPLGLAVVPTVDQRRVLEEMSPMSAGAEVRESLRAVLSSTMWLSIAYVPGRAVRVEAAPTAGVKPAELAGRLKDLFDRLGNVGGPKNAPWQFLSVHAQVRASADHALIEWIGADAVNQTFLSAFQSAKAASERRTVLGKLQQVGLAMHNYLDAGKGDASKRRFMDSCSRDANGRPLLSWRVHLLPYLDQSELYRQFHLDEPWDGEHNRKLMERMPDVYKVGGDAEASKAGKTCLQLPIGEKTVFPGGRGLSIREIVDGTSQTILAVEVDDEHAVPWTKPGDWTYDPAEPHRGLGRAYGAGFVSLFADASARFISSQTNRDVLRALLTATGREAIELP